MPTLPMSSIISATPSVLSAGGTALALNGLVLTNSTRVPLGTVLSFPSAASVGAYFGLSSAQYTGALTYFAGFTTSTVKPGSILYAQYNESAVSGWLRGGSLAAMTLTQLQALSGTIILTVGGTQFTSSTITLSSATSFSNAATIIQAAFTSPTFAVTFDSIASAFVFTTTATGSAATITYATGTLSASLLLTQATGAVISQGAAAASPSTFMPTITAYTTNWVAFCTDFDPDNGSGNTQKLAFAAWTNTTGNRYAYIAWDTDITPTESTQATTSLGYLVTVTDLYSGTVPIYAPVNGALVAYFVLGAIASINTNAVNGRITLAFKSGTGIVSDVSSLTAAANLQANGYSYYAEYSEVTNNYLFFYPGSISGPYEWLDSYINQIWLNSQFKNALAALVTSVNSIPYNATGNAMIETALSTPIQAFVNFGGCDAGATLSGTQIADVNAAAGIDVATTLQNRGWYLQVLTASATVRAARTSPPINFWYVDGGSVQAMNVSSIEVQ